MSTSCKPEVWSSPRSHGAARVNIAAVNYYFRDKETLYIEVVTHSFRYAMSKYPPTLGLADDASLEEQLEVMKNKMHLVTGSNGLIGSEIFMHFD